MTAFRLKLALLVLFLLPAVAAAQTFPTVPPNTVIGRTGFGSGPASAIPFSSITANLCNAFTTTTKGCVPAPVTATGRYLGDDAAWHAQNTQQVVAGAGVTLGGTCSGNSINCTVNATSATQYVLPSRAAAAASDLSALSAIRTLGYATPGDGGGATFKNVASTPFQDSFISTCAVTGGSGYANGTYYNIAVTGGTGTGINGIITVSGGAVTSYNFRYAPGNGYTVGDVLTVSNALIGGSGSGFSCTVSALTTPTASFTDSAGNHWQYVPDTEVVPNIKQFGAKVDGSTNDFQTIQNALWYAGRIGNGVPVGGPGFIGGKVLIGSGTTVLCPSTVTQMVVPFGVTLEGASFGSNIDICSAWPMGANVIMLGNGDTHAAAFKSMLRNVTITFPRGIAVPATLSIIFSNNTQDGGGLDHVYIYPGQFGCMTFLTGYGGASTVYMNDVSCSLEGANIGATFNYGTTLINMKNMVFGAPTSGTNNTTTAMQLNGGMYHIEGFHTEHIPVGIEVNMSGTITENMVTIQNATGGTGCTSLIKLTASNVAGNTALQQVANNGCTTLVTNNQPSGSNRAGVVAPKDGWVFFNP